MKAHTPHRSPNKPGSHLDSWWGNFAKGFTAVSSLTGISLLVALLPLGKASEFALNWAIAGIIIYAVSSIGIAFISAAYAFQLWHASHKKISPRLYPIMLLQPIGIAPQTFFAQPRFIEKPIPHRLSYNKERAHAHERYIH